MIRLALLYGGRSGEHEVSCRSAASILQNLDASRYDVIPVSIDHDGGWHLQSEPIVPGTESLPVDRKAPPVGVFPGTGLAVDGTALAIDVVFPILHGSFGEDGTVQGLLEMAELPYVGSGVLASAAGMDKEVMKRLWKEAGLSVAPFASFTKPTSGDIGTDIEETLVSAGLSPHDELFVKPARGGSSVGITHVRNAGEIANALTAAFQYDTKAIVEQRIRGREIECAVIGNDRLQTFPPGEIVPTAGFYDYDAKYVDPDGARLLVPAELPAALADDVQSLASSAYQTLEAEGYARVDLFVTDDGSSFLNEINTIPGFTSISMFPRMCQAGGVGYSDLLDRLVQLGLERFERKSALQYRYQPTSAQKSSPA